MLGHTWQSLGVVRHMREVRTCGDFGGVRCLGKKALPAYGLTVKYSNSCCPQLSFTKTVYRPGVNMLKE